MVMRWTWFVMVGVAAVLVAPHTRPASAETDRSEPIPLKKGHPTAAGLGKLAVLTNFPSSDKRYKVLKAYAKARGAKLIKFKEGDLQSTRKRLQRTGAEFVALAMTPESIDTNFHYSALEFCRDLDDDPMPDFHFGYITARDGADLETLFAAIRAREERAAGESDKTPSAKVVGLTGTGAHLKGLDYFLHFGHGQAWRVEGGLTGEQVGALDLPRAPVIWSGACFNGVFSRSFHKCAYQMVFLSPMTIDPAKLMTLNWVHAGASAYFAALEGDRGEMAMAEWEYFRQRACSVGETIGYQYRLAFMSLPPDFTRFPRQKHMFKKRMGFYDVMLRGMVSRVLLSDPSFRPLAKPLDERSDEAEVVYDTASKQLKLTARVTRWSQGLYLNYLPKSGKGVFDRRFYVRVPLPDDAPAKFGQETVKVTNGPELVALTRHHIRHEVWGGQRYLNVQVEALAGKIKSGTTMEVVLPAP